MRKRNDTQAERPSRGHTLDVMITLLAAAGLQAKQVERCPDPTCPLCSGGGRVAA